MLYMYMLKHCLKCYAENMAYNIKEKVRDKCD